MVKCEVQPSLYMNYITKGLTKLGYLPVVHSSMESSSPVLRPDLELSTGAALGLGPLGALRE